MMKNSERRKHERAHGKLLSLRNPIEIWGWGTPAGQLRAQRRAALIIEGAHLAPGLFALEIGCGTGMFSEMFLASGARLLAVDISYDLLEQARARNSTAGQIKFLEMPFEDCQENGPFDAVIGSSVLHHLDVNFALQKIYTMLKPGGYMCFAEPSMLNPQVFIERKLAFLRGWFWYVSPDETAFWRWPIHNLLERSGFTEIEITPFDWLHPRTPPAWIDAVQKLGKMMEKIPILREIAGSLMIRGCRPISE